nr:immunoglobulin light chain junction region [Macaca mulatta]MOV96416.1 immunoglobulin light chain junction region [Macaca mulatta]MOV96575.1 immunoglobulin light chain junction region [Macaca mulatta]MOV97426.1 immunoglobulin light chain junction region [Macaca mulatta]MOV98542.1 immunoglobulin light chain junction region [Macaca mulatta]
EYYCWLYYSGAGLF